MHPLSRLDHPSAAAGRRASRHFRAVVFDMDGVITDTAGVHAHAWKALFDSALPEVGALPQNAAAVAADPTATRPFDAHTDYLAHVDGKPREDGVRSLFAARGLTLSDDDVHRYAAQKQDHFNAVLESDGVRVFPEAQELLDALRADGVPTALVTSSRNSTAVLTAGGVSEYFDVVVDGTTALEEGIPGKPAPDMFLAAARKLGEDPQDCMVLEDAVSGVTAAAAGGFGLVVGVDRGGDPERLRAAGAHVVAADFSELELRERTTRPFDPNWVLAYDGFDPDHETTREALCTLANGYWGTRGSVPGASAGAVHYPGTYLAGVFNRLTTPVQGREVETEHMVNAPDWTFLEVTPTGGDPLTPLSEELIDYRQELDLRRGLLTRTMRFRDDDGRTTRLTTRQFQSMAGHHLAGLELTVEAEDWDGEITVRSAINGRVANQNVADDRLLANHHLEHTTGRTLDGETVLLETETSQSEVRIAVAARTRLVPGPGRLEAPDEPIRLPVDEPDLIGQDISFLVTRGTPVRLEKIAAASTSRDHALSTVWHSSAKRVARTESFRSLLTFHEQMWGILWQRFAVEIEQGERTDPETGETRGTHERHQLALNLHSFHVLQTSFGSRRDLDAGLGARGLHGEGYRGHIFWDEIFVYPMLSLRRPTLTRGLLMYRFRRLGEARELARQEGRAGAMFPWQSGSDGREETPTELWNPRSQMWMPDNSHNQRHVSLAVAYSVLRYFEISADESFLSDYGAEILIEVCRAFASMAERDEDTGRYTISGVMGPDEYHDGYPDTPGSGLRNNAYTNVLAAWMMRRTAEILRWLDGRADPLSEWLGVRSGEIEGWEDIASHLTVPFFPDGVMAQFEGYEDLLEFDWEGYRAKYGNIGRLDLILQAEGDATNRYKLSKQADTLMLAYLFSSEELQDQLEHMGYSFDSDDFEATVAYYLARTSHGSTLSRLVHGWVAARTDRSGSWALFEEALEADLSDTQGGTTREGVHLGAMAGTVDMVIRCYAGVETRGGVLRLHPQLPAELPGVRFTIRFKEQPVWVRINHASVTVRLLDSSSEPIELSIEGERRTMSPGESWTHSLEEAPAAV